MYNRLLFHLFPLEGTARYADQLLAPVSLDKSCVLKKLAMANVKVIYLDIPIVRAMSIVRHGICKNFMLTRVLGLIYI